MQWQKKNFLKNALSVIWKSKAFILLAVPLIGCPFRPLDTMKSVGAVGFLSPACLICTLSPMQSALMWS